MPPAGQCPSCSGTCCCSSPILASSWHRAHPFRATPSPSPCASWCPGRLGPMSCPSSQLSCHPQHAHCQGWTPDTSQSCPLPCPTQRLCPSGAGHKFHHHPMSSVARRWAGRTVALSAPPAANSPRCSNETIGPTIPLHHSGSWRGIFTCLLWVAPPLLEASPDIQQKLSRRPIVMRCWLTWPLWFISWLLGRFPWTSPLISQEPPSMPYQKGTLMSAQLPLAKPCDALSPNACVTQWKTWRGITSILCRSGSPSHWGPKLPSTLPANGASALPASLTWSSSAWTSRMPSTPSIVWVCCGRSGSGFLAWLLGLNGLMVARRASSSTVKPSLPKPVFSKAILWAPFSSRWPFSRPSAPLAFAPQAALSSCLPTWMMFASLGPGTKLLPPSNVSTGQLAR